MDLETGGLDPLSSPILTGYFCFLDKNLNKIAELELKIRPDEIYSKVDQKALDVNNIDLKKHLEDSDTLSRLEAGTKLKEFLAKFGGKNKKDKNRPKPLGHNVSFDLSFMPQIISKEDFESHIHYGNICTKVITDFLKDVGVLPEEVGTLQSLVTYFNIPQLKAHSAKDDTLMMVAVYDKLIQMVKSSVGGPSLSMDVLSMLEK